MRFSCSLFACAVVTFIVCATSGPAVAAIPHTVQPGETLWSIAAANNFTTRALAVVCDVGQGDALVLPLAPGRAVVVDAGPEPGATVAKGGSLGDSVPAAPSNR